MDAIADLPVDGAIDAYNTIWDPTGERVLFYLSPAAGNDGLQVVPASGTPRAPVSEAFETASLGSDGPRS